MGKPEKTNKSIDKVIERDIQKIQRGEFARIFGGRSNKKKNRSKYDNNDGMKNLPPQ